MRCRYFLFAAATALLAAPAYASFPPKVFKASKEEIARRCESLGERASYTAWDYKPGEYGCVDTKTGFTLICQEKTEICKLYFPARIPPEKQKRTVKAPAPAKNSGNITIKPIALPASFLKARLAPGTL